MYWTILMFIGILQCIISQPSSPVNSFPIHTISEGEGISNTPPPLPTRNRSFHSPGSQRMPTGAGPPLSQRCNNLQVSCNNGAASLSNKSGCGQGDENSSEAVPNTIAHHRTKSNPDPLGSQSQVHSMTPVEACKRLLTSESFQDLYKRSKSHPGSCDVDSPHESPSGTPPPPYRGIVDEGGGEDEVQIRSHGDQISEVSPLRGSIGPQTSTPIGQNIMSMEDDDTSDQELSHLEDHGPFKSLKCLWQHHAHLAVFMNYVLSNSDPSSLLFYLVTDLYKEGSAKEMKKWAYEIHSSFLVPGAPLRLNNVDENFAREIDDVLIRESDKEEILRMIFWKARNRAREELNEQLADFQQKRTAGLGTLFGPCDASLDESIHDKNKEMKIIESILVPKIESYMEDIEKDNVDIRRFTTAAALGTIMGKVFGLRGPHASSVLDRCPTFVSKDKSLKVKLLIGKSRKLSVRGHNFVAHYYYTVTYCNHCQLIIWGIGPQGYQCSNCNFNVHRHNCVRAVDENCPGPICKKDKGDNRISKLMEKIRPEREARRKPSSLNFSQIERAKKHLEERDDAGGIGDGDSTMGTYE
ncbi:hypothetical protein RUM44_003447 [Polyplax serrata]|uniref:Phorbol-ester/DAG-type domain-containing protein n=1 Tax=Polyplax serrata TaxID=468196 RepID=A0ABR1AGI0_POLSC